MIQDLIKWNIPYYVYLILFIILSIEHIYFAIVYSKVGKAEKYKYWYFAWIPVLNIFMIINLGETNKICLLSILGLAIPSLWIFGLVAFLAYLAGNIHDVMNRYGVNSLLIYIGIVIPFLSFIPLKELHSRAIFNIKYGYDAHPQKLDYYDHKL